MKILSTYVLLISYLFSFSSCNNDRITQLEKEVNGLKKHIELTHQISLRDTTSVPDFKWFRLGQPSYHMVNNNFIVESITSEYKINGYEITGIVTNLMSLKTIQTKIFGAIINISKTKKVITGFIEIPVLNPGEKTEFQLFIPTSQTDVNKVGIKISTGRM